MITKVCFKPLHQGKSLKDNLQQSRHIRIKTETSNPNTDNSQKMLHPHVTAKPTEAVVGKPLAISPNRDRTDQIPRSLPAPPISISPPHHRPQSQTMGSRGLRRADWSG